MNNYYLTTVPIVSINNEISKILPLLERHTAPDQYSIFVDKQGQVMGLINNAILYRMYYSACPSTWNLHDILNEKYTSILENASPDMAIIASTIPVIVINDKGCPLGLFNKIRYLVDLHKQTESKIHDLKQELSATSISLYNLNNILDHSYDELMVVDKDGVCTMINAACTRLYDMKKEDIIGKSVGQLVSMKFTSSSLCDKAILEKRRITNIQTTATGIRIIATANPLYDINKELIGAVLNTREIAELSNISYFFEKLSDSTKTDELYKQARKQLHKENFTAESTAMRKIIKIMANIALVDSTVLLLGESGVGKSEIARMLHLLSHRRNHPFIKVNCGAIPRNLIESELFGYVRGAFTGANTSGKIGLFELADKGTLLLDEIGDLPKNVQASLLHAIQDKSITRVGDSKVKSVDCRIITATNYDLQAMVTDGSFREDLFYRLNVIPLTVPPLRQRKKDIPILVSNLLKFFNKKFCLKKSIAPSALAYFIKYHWPGNIRELENLMERLMVIMAKDVIEYSDIMLMTPRAPLESSEEKMPDIILASSLKATLDALEKNILEEAALSYKTTYEIASALQINQATVVRKLQKYNIQIKKSNKDGTD